MDWEGGTIGAIVPALMGYGEAGRASPWPFFLCQPRITGNLQLRKQLCDYFPVSYKCDGSTSVAVKLRCRIDS
jgi:hypothetical protein